MYLQQVRITWRIPCEHVDRVEDPRTLFRYVSLYSLDVFLVVNWQLVELVHIKKKVWDTFDEDLHFPISS